MSFPQTPNPPEINLDHELRDRLNRSALVHERNARGSSLDDEHFKSPTEGGHNKLEGGGEIDQDKEEDRKGSNYKPTANREQVGDGSAEGTHARDIEEQDDTKEQQEQLQKMYQTLIYKLTVDFGSDKI